jgi:hypothetical protein
MVSFFVFWGFLLIKMYFPQDSVFGRTRANIQKDLHVKFVNVTVGSVLNSEAVQALSNSAHFHSANETFRSEAEGANQTRGWHRLINHTSGWSELTNQTSGWSELTNQTSGRPEVNNHQRTGGIDGSYNTSGWSESAYPSPHWPERANKTRDQWPWARLFNNS